MNQKYNTGDYLTFKGKVERADGIICQKLDVIYHVSDSRVWTALINPHKENIFVTLHVNRNYLGEVSFDVLANQKEYINVDWEFIHDVIEPLIQIVQTTPTE